LFSQMEHLQLKYVGTGHADINKFEWGVNMHRDSLASYIGHRPMLHFLGIAMNRSTERERAHLLMKMVAPMGPPPAREDEDD